MYLISSISLKSGFPQIVEFLRKSYEKKMHKNNTTSLEIVSPPLVNFGYSEKATKIEKIFH